MKVSQGIAGFGEAEVSDGSRGDTVKILQSLLVTAGFPVVADGIFGPKTKEAVQTFQASQRLQPTGIVESVTWELLHHVAGQNPAALIKPVPVLVTPIAASTTDYNTNLQPMASEIAAAKRAALPWFERIPEWVIPVAGIASGLFVIGIALKARKGSSVAMAGYRRRRRNKR